MKVSLTVITIILLVLIVPGCNDVLSTASEEASNPVICVSDNNYNTALMTNFANAFLTVSASSSGTINGSQGGSCSITLIAYRPSFPYEPEYVHYDFTSFNNTGTAYTGRLTLTRYWNGGICTPCGVQDANCTFCTVLSGTITGSGYYSGTIEYHLYGLNTQLADSGYYSVNCQIINY